MVFSNSASDFRADFDDPAIDRASTHMNAVLSEEIGDIAIREAFPLPVA